MAPPEVFSNCSIVKIWRKIVMWPLLPCLPLGTSIRTSMSYSVPRFAGRPGVLSVASIVAPAERVKRDGWQSSG